MPRYHIQDNQTNLTGKTTRKHKRTKRIEGHTLVQGWRQSTAWKLQAYNLKAYDFKYPRSMTATKTHITLCNKQFIPIITIWIHPKQVDFGINQQLITNPRNTKQDGITLRCDIH